MNIMKRILCVSVIASALATPLFCEDSIKPKMVRIPGKNYEMMTTEVTQGLYESVMGENPSYFRNDNEDLDDEERDNLSENTKNNPVENVSWYDAIYFCNKLSEKEGLEPVYEVDGETGVEKWDYIPHNEKKIDGEITRNENANGYRLPIVEEWRYAARGGENFIYSGSNNIDEVAWYSGNSGNTTHPIAQKKANGYGLYDMSGNVLEWCWDVYLEWCWNVYPDDGDYSRYICGGCWGIYADYCEVDGRIDSDADCRGANIGFRLVRSLSKFCEDNLKPKMVRIPGRNYEMMTTEITQGLYESVMGENPSYFRNDNEDLDDEERDNLSENTKNNPVENVSWYDAIYFCNKLSEIEGLEPVYAVDGETGVEKWSYIPHYDKEIAEEITQNPKANGYRLPTREEWQYAVKGGKDYAYAGSDDIDEVGWYDGNSGNTTHPVAQKKANGYGLYDMGGNVNEWCWDVGLYYSNSRCNCGGSWFSSAYGLDFRYNYYAGCRSDDLGFRLVRSLTN